MKDEKQAEIDRKREITKERKLKAAEKARLEQMAAKVRLHAAAPALDRLMLVFADEREEAAANEEAHGSNEENCSLNRPHVTGVLGNHHVAL